MTTRPHKFLGRSTGENTCHCCGRRVVHRYDIQDTATGDIEVYGRRCAARLMGWATTRVEMEAKIAERIAEVTRREAIVHAAYPVLAEAKQLTTAEAAAAKANGFQFVTPRHHLASEYHVGRTAICTDWMWRDGGSWREYIDDNMTTV